MMPDHFLLDENKNLVRATDMIEYIRWFDNPENRLVGYDEVGEVAVSTVFLGLDENKSGRGAPLFFETRVFGGKLDREKEFHSTWSDAEEGHRRMVEKVRQAEGE